MHNNLQAIKISENVYWVGAIDWKLRDFHGYSTSHGSTYNAYLILGEKPILIDTVKAQFYEEMLARISSVIDPQNIRYLISNHSEMDHSGSIPKFIDLVHPEKIFASKLGVPTLKEHFHFNAEITAVNDEEIITLGNRSFKFIETRMIHWPESMFTYYLDEKILFSQDGFGMHFATSEIFSEQNDQCILEYEAKKYFANILLPYTSLINKLLTKLSQLNLEPTMIAPAHGPVWENQNKVRKILDLWRKWANKPFLPKAIIIYDTMWGSTENMAKMIADGINQENIDVKIMPISAVRRSDVITELLDAGALLVGSPTLNQEILPTVADVLCYIHGLKPQNLIGQIFSSYGWGNEAQKILIEYMKNMKIELIGEPIKVKYVPTEEILQNCRLLGINIAKTLKDKIGTVNDSLGWSRNR